jgi:hypothetical protein
MRAAGWRTERAARLALSRPRPWPSWSAKVEYLHYDLGAVQFAAGPLLTIPAGAVFAGAQRLPLRHSHCDNVHTVLRRPCSRRGELSLHPELTHRRRCSHPVVLRPVICLGRRWLRSKIRMVFGTVGVRNRRRMRCRRCLPHTCMAFTTLGEICPGLATPELMDLAAWVGSMLPYRNAPKLLAEFLSIEPPESHM